MTNEKNSISMAALQRLTKYLNYMRSLPQDSAVNISATAIAEAMGLNQVQVRKDLAAVSSGGKPRVGYVTAQLISEIEDFLGYNNLRSAVLVGAGHLGRALLASQAFQDHGMEIVVAFDNDPQIINTEINDKCIFPIEKLANLCGRLKVHIGIITVGADAAQEVCDMLVDAGVRAIWNFAPVTLRVPKYVVVKNEDMAASLAVLSNMLSENIRQYGKVITEKDK